MEQREPKIAPMDGLFREYLADIDHLPYGTAIVKNDATSTVIQANPAYYRIIGHTKEELWENYGNRIAEILIDNVYSLVERQPMVADFDLEFDLRLRTAAGEIRWIHDFAHYNAAQDVFFITVTDITDKLLIRGNGLSYDAFRAKHEILAYMAKYTSEHIVVTDVATDEVVYMNPMAMKLLNFQRESDWLGKTYVDVIFGTSENAKACDYDPAAEDNFGEREYYNPYHKTHTHVEAKIIAIPAMQRKMRLNIITDITAQKQLEYKIGLHKTLQECINTLFTSTASNTVADTDYYAILHQLKVYYQADIAFFHRFQDGTYQVENFYEVYAEGIKKREYVLPVIIPDKQMKLYEKLSTVKTAHYLSVLDDLTQDEVSTLMEIHGAYAMDALACVVVKNKAGQIIAFMGVTNPHLHEDDKELMDLLSRFICLFIEHQEDQEIKEEAVLLEAASKASLIEASTKNFQSLGHAKDKISDSLDALCHHYDADFAVVLSRSENDGSYGVTFVGGTPTLDVAGLAYQSGYTMEKWKAIFQKHSQFVTDKDIDEPVLLGILAEKYGVQNFIVSPMHNGQGDLEGLLFVINYKFMNRAHFMVHVVAKNISDYLDRVRMHEKSQLEPATQLSNKITTHNQISQILEAGKTGTLFIIDIDNFKKLNDTLGHHVGDRALIDFAIALKHVFRTTDVVGRIGGDEFMVFTPGLVLNTLIEAKANQILVQCKRSYEHDGRQVTISASVGICCADGKHKTFQPLYENADYALYVAKKGGKNRHYIYADDQHMEDAVATDDLHFYHNVVHTLKSAIGKQCFVVHYQPIYHVPSKAYTQAEALVRIGKPDGTLIYPNDFVQVAESTGLAVDMTYQILEQVCRDFRALLDQQPDTTLTSISVNVPYLQFTEPDMEERFLEILGKYNIHPSQIKLEITERTLVSDMDLMTHRMASMMEAGFAFELDDFGTEYSNLKMCVSLPLDIIKLDRSLLLAAMASDADSRFFQYILLAIHESNRHTVMEGVETQAQLDWAIGCSCQYIQGYYFSKPVDFQHFVTLLAGGTGVAGGNGKLKMEN